MKSLFISVLKLFLPLLSVLALSACSKNTDHTETILWKTGEGSYGGYRIPSAVCTTKGTLLAFAEGRNNGGDTGDIDLVMKRSTDNGITWSEEFVIWNDSLNTCGNPCPVVDAETGRIWLWMTWNDGSDHETEIIFKTSKSPRVPFLCYSDDDGLSWSEPVDMSSSCKNPEWGWYATGPGFAIQQHNSKYKGNLVIPANHSYDDPEGSLRNGPFSYGAHVIISKDHGKTWQISSPIMPGCNESQVTELEDGTLLMNMRSYNNKYSRAISTSDDGGENWSPITHDYQLVESKCQASILHYGDYLEKSFHLFSNPAVPVGRSHMTIKVSSNNCESWEKGILVDENPAAYSCLVKLANGNIGLLYETGLRNPYETIRFISLDKEFLFDCKDLQYKN
ncbi:sialidase family protein [Maribellus sediminis]|uniref:sialidase family protein n=1 Tax=Maribellus sediminis TaxID=2696285 RepID=UPI001431F1D9|nr:sialidase family protein [Maribellus sediminis]